MTLANESFVAKEFPKIKLVEVARIVSGGTPKTSVEEYWDGEILWATPKDLSGLVGVEIDTTPRKITDSGLRNSSAELLPANSVLFSSRAPIGLLAINTAPMSTNQGFKSLVPDTSRLDSRYLYRWLEFEREWLQSLGVGATFKEVSKATMSRVELPLPPLSEQRRIAAILDKADHLRAQRRKALTHLEELTQSIFSDMFGNPNTDDHWDCLPMATLGQIITGNTPPRANSANFGDEIEWIKTNNINTPSMYLTEALEGLSTEGKSRGRYAPAGSILMTCIAGSPRVIGNVAVADREVAFNQQINAFVPHEGPAEYWHQLLTALQPATQKLSSGGMKGLVSKSALSTLEIPITPLELQQVFAERVAGIEKLKEQHRAQLAELDALFASLQHRAFRGEL